MNDGISQTKTMRHDWLQWAAVFPGSRASGRFLYLFIARALCGLFLFGVINPAMAAERASAKRVLIISTGSRFSVGFPFIEQNAVENLRQLRPNELEYYSEYLDIIRFPSEKHRQIFRDYLRQKYAEDAPDLIILFYVGNLVGAQTVLQQLFPTTPVIVAGLTEEDLSRASLGARTTGLAQRSDPDGTIKLILRLQPEIKRIVVVGGTAEVDREVLRRTRGVAQLY